VHVRTDLVPVDDMQLYLNAADLVVLPYGETLNSGAAILALSFDRPVLGPDRGAFAELASEFGPRVVQTFAGDVTSGVLATALRRAIAEPPGHLDLDALSWDRVAAGTIAAYRAVGAGGNGVRTLPA
jgi:hypothetical protein